MSILDNISTLPGNKLSVHINEFNFIFRGTKLCRILSNTGEELFEYDGDAVICNKFEKVVNEFTDRLTRCYLAMTDNTEFDIEYLKNANYNCICVGYGEMYQDKFRYEYDYKECNYLFIYRYVSKEIYIVIDDGDLYKIYMHKHHNTKARMKVLRPFSGDIYEYINYNIEPIILNKIPTNTKSARNKYGSTTISN